MVVEISPRNSQAEKPGRRMNMNDISRTIQASSFRLRRCVWKKKECLVVTHLV